MSSTLPPASSLLEALAARLRPGDDSAGQMRFDFRWNEGPDGNCVTWQQGVLSVDPGSQVQPLRQKSARKCVTQVHSPTDIDPLTGTVGSRVYLLLPNTQLNLTPAQVPVALADVIDLYLTVHQQAVTGTLRPQLSIRLPQPGTSAEHLLQFTPTATADLLVGVQTPQGTTISARLMEREQPGLGVALRRIVSGAAINSPTYLGRYAALHTLLQERRAQTEPLGFETSVHFTPQQVLLKGDAAGVRTVPYNAVLCRSPWPDERNDLVAITHVTAHPAGSWRPGHVTLDTDTGEQFPVHQELCLLLSELLPAWSGGHEVHFQNHVIGGPGINGTELAFLPEPGPDAGLLIQWTGHSARNAVPRQTWLRLDPALFGLLARALFATNRRTLTGAA